MRSRTQNTFEKWCEGGKIVPAKRCLGEEKEIDYSFVYIVFCVLRISLYFTVTHGATVMGQGTPNYLEPEIWDTFSIKSPLVSKIIVASYPNMAR